MKIKMSTLTAALTAFALVGTVHAATITLNAVADTYMVELNPDTAFYNDGRVLVGRNTPSPGYYRPLVRFSTSGIIIPAANEAIVTDVTLTTVNTSSTGAKYSPDIAVYDYGFEFVENGVTWNNPDGAPGGDPTPGGTIEGDVLASDPGMSSAANATNVFTTAAGGYFNTVVQDAINGDDTINLLFIKQSTSEEYALLLDNDNGFKLEVTYTTAFTERTWTSGSGNWSDTGAWSGSDWKTGVAKFDSATANITVDTNADVYGMDFAAGDYILSGANTITLNDNPDPAFDTIVLASSAQASITAPMTITADTAVSGGGVLLLNGSVAGDADGTTEVLTVGSGTAFGGTGTIGDGTNNVDITFAGDSLFYVVDPNSPLTVDDGPTITFDNGFSLESLTGNIGSLGPGTYTLIDGSFDLVYSGSNFGETNAGKLNGLDGYFKEGSLDLVILSASGIPEPSTLILAGLGMAGVLLRRRR